MKKTYFCWLYLYDDPSLEQDCLEVEAVSEEEAIDSCRSFGVVVSIEEVGRG